MSFPTYNIQYILTQRFWWNKDSMVHLSDNVTYLHTPFKVDLLGDASHMNMNIKLWFGNGMIYGFMLVKAFNRKSKTRPNLKLVK